MTLCRSDRARCPSAPALRLLSIIDSARGREGLARLGEINRSINLAIRPMSDLMQYHVEDHGVLHLRHWLPCGRLRGLCHREIRRAAGGGRCTNDLRLIIMRNTLSGEDHAVVAARFEDRWRLLDNRYLVMLEGRAGFVAIIDIRYRRTRSQALRRNPDRQGEQVS